MGLAALESSEFPQESNIVTLSTSASQIAEIAARRRQPNQRQSR